MLIAVSLDVWSEAQACPGLHLCLCVAEGAQGSHGGEIVLPSSSSCSYGFGLGVPRGCLVVRAVFRERPSLVFILTIPLITVGIMRAFGFNCLWRRMQVLSTQ